MKQRLLHLVLVLLAALAVQAQELVVCSYNVRNKNTNDTNEGNGWDTRRTYINNFINFQQPDLLGVQEAKSGQMNDMANGLIGYKYIGVGRNDGGTSGEYAGIFYRTERMELLDHGDFWLSDTPYTPSKGFPSKGGSTQYYRICTWGKFYDKAASKVVYYFNTHYDLDETNRQQSFYVIRDKIKEIASTTDPVIISGDFNAQPTANSYKYFINSKFLYDCYDQAKQKFAPNATNSGFDGNNYLTSSGSITRIDHIFVTKVFNITHYGILNPCYYSTSGTASYNVRAYSDHNPIIAKLTYKTTVPSVELCTTPPPSIDGVYQISTPEELQAFTYIVNGIAGHKKNTAANAILLNDIDMKEMGTWLPIGSKDAPFTGTFDGKGHSILNLTVKTSKGYSGMFGKTQKATIKNFKVGGTIVISEGTCDHGIVGYAEGTTISDVHSALEITTSIANNATQHIGGVAGTMASSSNINRCSYTGKITDAGTNTVGGIVGYADQKPNKISNAINYGTVNSKGKETNTGGILGYVNYAGFEISNCANVGTISGAEEFAGQIIGRQLKAMSTRPSNLYYLDEATLSAFGSGTNTTSATGATAVSTEQLASGEVCYKLNGDQKEINWYQNLPSADTTVESDSYPVLDPTHQIVLFTDGVYHNPINPDGIKEIDGEVSDANGQSLIYNLSGQRMNKVQKGINIINGKKYIVK